MSCQANYKELISKQLNFDDFFLDFNYTCLPLFTASDLPQMCNQVLQGGDARGR